MALSHADACPKMPHIEINDIKFIIKDQGKNQVTVRIQVVNGNIKVRDLIPREIANISMLH